VKNEYRENVKALGSVRMSLKQSYQQELEEEMAAQIEDTDNGEAILRPSKWNYNKHQKQMKMTCMKWW